MRVEFAQHLQNSPMMVSGALAFACHQRQVSAVGLVVCIAQKHHALCGESGREKNPGLGRWMTCRLMGSPVTDGAQMICVSLQLQSYNRAIC